MNGLNSSQVSRFLNKHGLNIIEDQREKPIYFKFFEQFYNFLTILLLFAAVVSLLIGETIDGALIFGIVILNAIFGLYQEIKAEESINALKKMTVNKVRVIRDGMEQEIESKYLVPGDMMLVEEGVKASADGVIIEGMNLEMNESVLTGESMSVEKKIKDLVYSGSIVARGRAWVRVNSTGNQTKFGKIAHELTAITDTKSPMQKKLEDLTRIIGILGIIAAVLVFIGSYLHGSSYFPAFLLAISLAVAVVPEGLPAVMTITLAIGVKEMAKRKAIIRKLSSIEALGSITLIATDKTGTLTENKMRVKEIYVDDVIEILSNVGNRHAYSLREKYLQKNFVLSSFGLLLLNAILCSTASLVYDSTGKPKDILGDPTEGALLYMADDAGLSVEKVRKDWKIIDEKPFNSVSKLMSVVVSSAGNGLKPFRTNPINFTKGAPESILDLCNKMMIGEKERKLDSKERKKIEEQVDKWARSGLRVLAFAYKRQIAAVNNRANMVFLGMVALHDATRPEVIEAVAKAKKAGIKVVMITGDNEKTAEAIGLTTGLIQKGDELITGVELDEYSDEDLSKILPRVKIFARTSPFQKHRIVKLYQQLGEIVAVTGDGVNDAIALKQADVGIAMGRVGTDVARETADMVITDDNFATIVNAVEEGRNIIKNIKNAVKYLLSCNIIEAATLIIGLFLGLPTLFYPVQLLYINLITDGLPALALAFSPRNPRLMEDSPQEESAILKNTDKSYIGLIGLMGSILVLGSFYLFARNFTGLGKTAAFSVLTLIQSFIFVDLWLSHHSIRKHFSQLKSPIFLVSFVFPFIAQFFIVNNPFISQFFKIQSVSMFIYVQFILMAGVILVGVKVTQKLFINRKRNRA